MELLKEDKMNRRAKKNIESVFIIGLFTLVLLSVFVFATDPYVIYSAPAISTFDNASESSAKFFNITINWTNASGSILINNWSQVNISLPPNFTFVRAEFNGTSATGTFSNFSNFNAHDNISNVLTWSNFTGILINGSRNATFWFNATPGTAGWFNITVTIVNQTQGSGAGAYSQVYRNISVFVNTTSGAEKFVNTTSGATVPAGENFSALKSGMNYSGNFTVRITGTVDYPEILRIEITNGSTNGALLINHTGNQSVVGANADGYWYRRINSSIGSIANATNGSSMFYNFTIIVREHTHNLTNYTVFSHIRFDATKPIVQSANISSPLNGGNYSQNITLNVTGTDATGIIGFWNFTNASAHGAGNNTLKQNLTLEITRSDGNIMISDFNTTYLKDGYYNISFFANDTAGNSNNHSDTYDGAPKVVLVVIDNSVPTVTLTKNTASTTSTSLVINIAASDNWPGNVSGQCTHDQGSSGSISGSGSGTQTFTRTGLNCGNSATVQITCTDYAGNSRTSSITASTNSCAGGSGGGGGGGGGGPETSTTWTATFAKDDKELSTKGEVTQSLGSKQRVKLKVKDTIYVGVQSLTENSATIEVMASPPQIKTLNVGQDAKFNVDDDSTDYDVYVKLNSITNDKADLTIRAINEEIPAAQQPGETGETTGTPAGTGGAGEETGVPPGGGGKIIAIVIVLLVIIGIVVFFVLKKRNQ